MPFTPFNAETARIAAIKSHSPGSRRFLPRPAPEPEPQPAPLTFTPATAQHASQLTRAFELKLDALINTEDAKECAALARCCRELRETYHLVTGEAKPGQRRPGRERRQDQTQAQPLVAPTPQPIVVAALVVSAETTPDAKPSESTPEQKPVS